MDTELIILDDLFTRSKIEPSFIILLEDEGLINITVIEGKRYIQESQLDELERFANLYYELSINIEGIDAIQNLLLRIDNLETELQQLRQLRDYHKKLWSIEEE